MGRSISASSTRRDARSNSVSSSHAYSQSNGFREEDEEDGGELPVTLVGLPQSDMYMMGRQVRSPPRGTLNVCRLATEHGIEVAMGVNNVQNAFTPQGSVDPLGLCPLGVALFQGATDGDCVRLLVSGERGLT